MTDVALNILPFYAVVNLLRPVIQPLSAAFAADFIAFTLLNTREMKLFGVSSLL